jgi:queuine/archaeosine tRNA-ribosyltransferase
MEDSRKAIFNNSFLEFKKDFLEKYSENSPGK